MARWINEVKAGAALSLLALLCVAAPGHAQSSAYGCEGLVDSDALPAVEGDGGMFYRVDPDLMMVQGLTDGNVMQIAALSEALASQGVTLVYLPIPSKALGQPWQLPPMARYLGFDIDVATTVHDLGLQALERAGVAVVDARAALASASLVEPAYFGPDPRLTPHGARALAQAIAAQVTTRLSLPGAAFPVIAGEAVQIDSAMRLDLQESCGSTLPHPIALRIMSADDKAPGALLDGDTARIALVGTEMTGEPVTNLPALLQEASGLSVAVYSAPGGGPFAALSSYLTSDAYRVFKPDVLVWEHPVWENLAQTGDQPIREVIAAASGACTVSVPMMASGNRAPLEADLTRLPETPDMLLIDADGIPGAVHVAFMDERGLRRVRHVYRNEDAHLTGRFYVPLSGLAESGATSIEITFDGRPGPDARLFACLPGEVN
ncbi:alginate O-acetyltransferase AlgX-related protein [Tropicibacter sp. S64]|uniref:alginate O-acetyltransferase AlgX-related protein n=1 Tax=Tropicibacter sp. S64 TaxID=3415122 RepID=UPI003C7D07CF